MFDFLCDRKLLIGIGIGILIGTGCMMGAKTAQNQSKSSIEQKAREMGMVYPDEAKVITDKDVKK